MGEGFRWGIKRKGIFLFSLLLLSLLVCSIQPVSGAITFYLEKEWVRVDVNKDGSISLFYNVTVVVTGEVQQGIYLGMPNQYISQASAQDSQGHELRLEVQPSQSRLKIWSHKESPSGTKNTIYAKARIDKMVYEDEMNPGNVGVKFIPGWWDFSDKMDLTVLIVLPEGVKIEEQKHTPKVTDFKIIDGRIAGYWERRDWSARSKFVVGISFPAQYVTSYEEAPPAGTPTWIWFVIIPVIGISAISVFIIRSRRKREGSEPYSPPSLSMETIPSMGGTEEEPESAHEELDAIEVATLLLVDPFKILTMILLSIAKKGGVRVLQVSPTVKVMKQSSPPLRYYERAMITAINPDGTLNEEALVNVLRTLRHNLDDKILFHSRRDTEKLYEKKIKDTWKEVQKTKMPGIKFRRFNDNLFLLMCARDFIKGTKRALKKSSEKVHFSTYQNLLPMKPGFWGGQDYVKNFLRAIEATQKT